MLQGQPQQQPLNLGSQPQQPAQIPPPPFQSGQDWNLSSVLHYLQTEWRKYERDRNEWEIERAEMRARIALLEGERRSFENVKLDLMRRIKMLEYALRMERSKQLTQPAPASQSVPPAKLAAIQALTSSSSQKDDVQSHKEESSGSSPRSEDSPLPDARVNGAASIGPTGRPNSWGWTNGPSTGTVAGLGKPPPGRDPKSRARSRDYLKQCLQEISYLTSPQAMNPLPNRPLLNNGSIALTLPNAPPFEQMAFNGRPRKLLPESGKDFPMLNGNINLMSGPSSAPAATQGSHIPNLERPNPLGSGMLQMQQQHMPQQQQQSSPNMMQQNVVPSQLPPPSNTTNERDREVDSEPRQLTAIFRPDDAGEWKEKLRLSHEAEQARFARENQQGWDRRPEDDEGKEDEGEVDDDESSVVSDGEGNKVWKPKRTLRNHLDAVRALAFHPHELSLATGGDDCTVKIWRMDVSGLASSASRPTTEIEPQLTLRGHSAAITRLIHAPSKQLLYSASLDSSIRVWALPSPSHTTYAPYDETRARGELIGHTDAVWDLALVRDESTLISCGAEGTVKVWDVSGPSGGGSLKLTWAWSGLENADELQEDMDAPGATAVEALKVDLKKVAVAYQNAVVKIFDIENGKELSRLPTDISYDGTPATQINRIVSHPTMSLLVTAHEDKYIRIFDILTGQCTHSMLAHLDGVTSLSIDPAGFSLVSGSHDCSVRFWDLLGSRACVQEVTTHREKAREGVLDTEFHPSLPFMASAGADGVVKLYASS
ncbi:WD40-repeat-containing domain protein [Roridomyces roridus]|uniref:WD40-repeat-containing domain protein n=1 Tax=Roridomyces roridus TaxID=1738132 RepID=A0AAD7BX55_9AGAR|nr:WD40-repeat-containing domain protein [Roridomyces roridus]